MKELLSFLLIIPMLVNGQGESWIGLDIGPKLTYFDWAANNSQLSPSPLVGYVWGINASHELSKALILESGYYQNNYGTGFCYNGSCSVNTPSHLIKTFQVPARLKYRVGLIKEYVSITGQLGGVYMHKSKKLEKSQGGYGSWEPNGDTITIYENVKVVNKTSFFLLEAGLSTELRISKSFMISVLANYQFGFNTVAEVDINYTINSSPIETGKLSTEGSNMQFLLGMKYRLSNLWNPKS